MYRRQDRSGNHLPFIRGGRSGAGWRYGFDEPRLQDFGHRTHAAGARDESRRRLTALSLKRRAEPRSRLGAWLFDDGGMCVVLIVGLIALAIVGGAIGRY